MLNVIGVEVAKILRFADQLGRHITLPLA
jgi:hypothetical protein